MRKLITLHRIPKRPYAYCDCGRLAPNEIIFTSANRWMCDTCLEEFKQEVSNLNPGIKEKDSAK